MFFIDLDGTLLSSSSTLSDTNRDALHDLGRRGIPRVIATGRSPHVAQRIVGPEFPVDFLIASTGAAIYDWSSKSLMRQLALDAALAERVRSTLIQAAADFMAHAAVPDNHFFEYHSSGADNPDFQRRCDRHAEFASPGDGSSLGIVSQFLVIEPPGAPSLYTMLSERLTEAAVVLTTSPLDHQSRWIEIFPKEGGKGQAAEWLAAQLGTPRQRIAGIGNDYNDRDLLDWVAHPFVVANAPEDLAHSYERVAHHDEHGFADAVQRYLRRVA